VLRRHTPPVAGVGDDGPGSSSLRTHSFVWPDRWPPTCAGPGRHPPLQLGGSFERACTTDTTRRREGVSSCAAARPLRPRRSGRPYVSPCWLGRRYQVKNAKPDAVLRLHQTEFPWVKTSTVEPMGVEQVGVVEDLAASAVSGSPAAVSSVGSDPFAAAAHDPDQLHRLRVRRRCSRRSSVAATVCCRRTLAPGGDVVLLPPDRAAPPVRVRTLVHCLEQLGQP
jgi:hypothetical protein